jgi:glycosyltransferase involved in cell wall biosynthesis
MTSRVLWLTKGLGRGGAERLLTTSAAHLDNGRFSVEVAYLLPEKDAFVGRLEERGMTVHCLRASRDVAPGWVVRLRQLLRDGEYTLVHTHSPLSAAVVRLVAPRGLKVVHTEHNMWDRYRRSTYWANALTYRRNDAVIAVSHAVADSVPRRFLPAGLQQAGPTVVIHGTDLESSTESRLDRQSARAALGLPQDVPVVGTVGNLTPKKDHQTLVTAFAAVRRQVPEARLCVIGSGPLQGQLQRWVHDAGIADVTVLAGTRDDAPDLLPAFDVFALSSRFEGLSIALVEALAAGVPAVATRVGGVPEVLADSGAGLMVPAGDPTALAEALRTVLTDDERRRSMSADASARATAFDVRSAVRDIEALYDEVLSA